MARIDVSNAVAERILEIAKKEKLDEYVKLQFPEANTSAARNIAMGKVVTLLVQRYEGVRR